MVPSKRSGPNREDRVDADCGSPEMARTITERIEWPNYQEGRSHQPHLKEAQ